MSANSGDQEATDVGTARGRDYPSVRQYSIFCENRVGQLQNLIRTIETAQLRICALSVAENSECAIIRIVVSRPERAYELLTQKGYRFCEVDLLVVDLPDLTRPVLSILSTLLRAEINIHYSFPLLSRPHGIPSLAFFVDDHETAARVLTDAGFCVLTEGDISD